MQTRPGRARHKTSMGQVAVALSVSATARSRFYVAAWSVYSSVSPKQKDRNSMVSSATLPHSGDLFNFHIQVALALPNNPWANLSSQHKYATCITIVAWWCQYAIYLLHFPLLSHDARPLVFCVTPTFLLTMNDFTRCTFHLLVRHIILGSVVNVERSTNGDNMAISVAPPRPDELSEVPGVVCLKSSDPKKFICGIIPPTRSSRWHDTITQRSQFLFPLEWDGRSP
jgi:hypothetical protein